MPVVLRAHGLRFVIFVDDHPPPHVHVRGSGEARIGLTGDAPLLTVKGLGRADVVRARNAVREHRSEMMDVWKAIHG